MSLERSSVSCIKLFQGSWYILDCSIKSVMIQAIKRRSLEPDGVLSYVFRTQPG